MARTLFPAGDDLVVMRAFLRGTYNDPFYLASNPHATIRWSHTDGSELLVDDHAALAFVDGELVGKLAGRQYSMAATHLIIAAAKEIGETGRLAFETRTEPVVVHAGTKYTATRWVFFVDGHQINPHVAFVVAGRMSMQAYRMINGKHSPGLPPLGG